MFKSLNMLQLLLVIAVIGNVPIVLSKDDDCGAEEVEPVQMVDELIEAAAFGDLEFVKAVLKNGTKINGKSEIDGQRALIEASKYGQLPMVRFLLHHGAQPNLQNYFGDTALSVLFRKYDEDEVEFNRNAYNIAKILLWEGADISIKANDDWSAFLLAARNGQSDVVRLMIFNSQIRIKIDTTDGQHWTPLIWMSYHGHTDTVRLLLRYGAKVNRERTKNGDTALTWASARCHYDTVEFLLRNKANVNAITIFKQSSLYFAVANGCDRKLVDLLLKYGAV